MTDASIQTTEVPVREKQLLFQGSLEAVEINETDGPINVMRRILPFDKYSRTRAISFSRAINDVVGAGMFDLGAFAAARQSNSSFSSTGADFQSPRANFRKGDVPLTQFCESVPQNIQHDPPAHPESDRALCAYAEASNQTSDLP